MAPALSQGTQPCGEVRLEFRGQLALRARKEAVSGLPVKKKPTQECRARNVRGTGPARSTGPRDPALPEAFLPWNSLTLGTVTSLH